MTNAQWLGDWTKHWRGKSFRKLKAKLDACAAQLRAATELAQLVRERSGDEQMLALAERVLASSEGAQGVVK